MTTKKAGLINRIIALRREISIERIRLLCIHMDIERDYYRYNSPPGASK